MEPYPYPESIILHASLLGNGVDLISLSVGDKEGSLVKRGQSRRKLDPSTELESRRGTRSNKEDGGYRNSVHHPSSDSI
ncbi:unnamed protein product [Ceratitis capitata]|uniref:(Mediterranean fruit fly) hypothetical protein n=1 Tax=Ceratitis capitata TaxID=7213 RepID=A0A811VEC0_CERCA|nr:unnamed protein product [Ceratitis capitata]